MEKLVLENKYEIDGPYLVQYLLHQIKSQQFYTDLDLCQQCSVLQKIEGFKDFSRPISDFPVHFKADLIFKDLSRKSSKFKYFSGLCKPCYTNLKYLKKKRHFKLQYAFQ